MFQILAVDLMTFHHLGEGLNWMHALLSLNNSLDQRHELDTTSYSPLCLHIMPTIELSVHGHGKSCGSTRRAERGESCRSSAPHRDSFCGVCIASLSLSSCIKEPKDTPRRRVWWGGMQDDDAESGSTGHMHGYQQ
jgi:hypothetical protein